MSQMQITVHDGPLSWVSGFYVWFYMIYMTVWLLRESLFKLKQSKLEFYFLRNFLQVSNLKVQSSPWQVQWYMFFCLFVFLHHQSTNNKNQYIIYFLEVVLCAFTFSHFLVSCNANDIANMTDLLFIIIGSKHRSRWDGAFNFSGVCTLRFVIGVPHNLSTTTKREKRKKELKNCLHPEKLQLEITAQV